MAPRRRTPPRESTHAAPLSLRRSHRQCRDRTGQRIRSSTSPLGRRTGISPTTRLTVSFPFVIRAKHRDLGHRLRCSRGIRVCDCHGGFNSCYRVSRIRRAPCRGGDRGLDGLGRPQPQHAGVRSGAAILQRPAPRRPRTITVTSSIRKRERPISRYPSARVSEPAPVAPADAPAIRLYSLNQITLAAFLGSAFLGLGLPSKSRALWHPGGGAQ